MKADKGCFWGCLGATAVAALVFVGIAALAWLCSIVAGMRLDDDDSSD